jgi:hypothetical protein
MTNFERTVAVLAAHREARQWDDAAVARDLLGRLEVDPNGGGDPVVPAPAVELAQAVAAVDGMVNPVEPSSAAAIAASEASFDAAMSALVSPPTAG